MNYCDVVRTTFASGAMFACSFAFAADSAEDADEQDTRLRPRFTQEFSVGGMARMGGRDPGLVGKANGGTGTSINYDDGDLNYGRGMATLGAQGRSTLSVDSRTIEGSLEAVYFYDFLNATGHTDFHDLTEDARDRVGRGVYLNDAFIGVKGAADGASYRIRAGNQRLRWSDSASFGQSIAPVNPIAASRRYQPGNTAQDLVVALPMLTAELLSSTRAKFSGFYLFGFEPTEPEAAGSYLGANDYYSPGARYLQLGEGSALVPDEDVSVTSPVTPFGSRVPRAADRLPRASGQFGLRAETPELGASRVVMAGYGMRVHSREPIVSVHTGTLGGLTGTSATDYTSSGNYFLEYPRDVTVIGGSFKFKPAEYTQVSADLSRRFNQPLQIDDRLLLAAGLAPAAVTAACTPPSPAATCTGTIATLNRNPIIAGMGGISPTNAAAFFDTELSGYQRFDVSQWAVSAVQGLPPILGARQWYFSAEAGGLYIHGYKDGFLDASVSVRPDENGASRNAFATRSAWGYRLFSRIEFTDVGGFRSVAPSLTWIHDVRGNAPITLGTLLEGTRSYVVAIETGLEKSLSARIAWRSWLGRGNDADRYTDRDFLTFSLTWKF